MSAPDQQEDGAIGVPLESPTMWKPLLCFVSGDVLEPSKMTLDVNAAKISTASWLDETSRLFPATTTFLKEHTSVSREVFPNQYLCIRMRLGCS